MTSTELGLRAIADRVARALVVVEVDERPVAGFLAHRLDHGARLVTALHAVAEAQSVAMRVADGTLVVLEHLGAIDPTRDLAVFRLDDEGREALSVAEQPTAIAQGQAVIAQGQPGDESTLCLSLAGSTEEVSDELSLVLLPALAPAGSSGSVVLDELGEVVGVATRVLSNVGPVSVMVPAGHLLPLLSADARLPLSELAQLPVRKRIERRVPHHALSMLDGCSRTSLEDLGAAILAAIQIGAPAYNDGEIARCYEIYEECARKLVERSADAPGPRQALLEGLTRAASLDDVDAQAWAMRDTFDGLLGVLERWMETRGASTGAAKRKPILN